MLLRQRSKEKSDWQSGETETARRASLKYYTAKAGMFTTQAGWASDRITELTKKVQVRSRGAEPLLGM